MNQAIASGTSSAQIDVPPLPISDAWFAHHVTLTLSAVDEAEVVIGGERMGAISETFPTCASPTIPADVIALPSSGGGVGAGGSRSPAIEVAMLMLGLGAALAFVARGVVAAKRR